MTNHPLHQWVSTRDSSAPLPQVTFGNGLRLFVVTAGKGGWYECATGISWGETRDAAKYCKEHRAASTAKNDPAPNATRAKVELHCPYPSSDLIFVTHREAG